MAVFIAVLILLGLLVALPIAGIVWQSLRDDAGGFTFLNYGEFFKDSRLISAARNTLVVAAGSALGSVLVATPLAFGVARTNMGGKRLVQLAVLVSFASPPFLMTLAYILIAGPNNGLGNQFIRWILQLEQAVGPLDIFSVWGFLLLALPSSVALAFVIMLPGFGNMDPALEEASRIGGAGPIETIMRISLPVMRPGMFAGALLAFSSALAMFATPHILGIDVLTVSMRRSILLDGNFSLAATIAAISAAMSAVALFLYRRSIRAAREFQTISGRGYRPATLDLGAARFVFTGLGVVYAVLSALAPYTLLVLISFLRNPYDGIAAGNFTLENFRYIFTNPAVTDAIKNSLLIGVAAASVIAILGMLVGYIITRTRLRGRALADYIGILPLGIAGTAFAVGVLVVALQTPARNLSLYGTVWILLLAYIGRYVPWGIRTAQVSLLQVSRELEEASRIGGASVLKTIWHITAPLIRPGIAYAWILGMVQAVTEVSASVLLTTGQVNVISTVLLQTWAYDEGLQRASALGVVMFALTMTLVVIAQRIGGQSIVVDQSKPGAGASGVSIG